MPSELLVGAKKMAQNIGWLPTVMAENTEKRDGSVWSDAKI